MSLLPAYGNSDFSVANVQNHRELTLGRLVSSDGMQNLLNELSRIGCPGTANVLDDVYGVLNVSTGKARHGMSSNFHYDANTITLVVPLIMPEADQGSSAELVLFPNQRPFRRSVAIRLKNGRYNLWNMHSKWELGICSDSSRVMRICFGAIAHCMGHWRPQWVAFARRWRYIAEIRINTVGFSKHLGVCAPPRRGEPTSGADRPLAHGRLAAHSSGSDRPARSMCLGNY
jgi:hypothetical protein